MIKDIIALMLFIIMYGSAVIASALLIGFGLAVGINLGGGL